MNKKTNHHNHMVNAAEQDEPIETEETDTESFSYLVCPHCHNKRLEVGETSGGRVKQCHHCGGVWFNINELEKALGRGVKFSLPHPEIPMNIEINGNGVHQKPICPYCHVPLVRIRTLNAPDLEVDACVICQGRWLDGAEITRLQKRGFFSWMKELVMRLF